MGRSPVADPTNHGSFVEGRPGTNADDPTAKMEMPIEIHPMPPEAFSTAILLSGRYLSAPNPNMAAPCPPLEIATPGFATASPTPRSTAEPYLIPVRQGKSSPSWVVS
jgi:hypothetical protein